MRKLITSACMPDIKRLLEFKRYFRIKIKKKVDHPLLQLNAETDCGKSYGGKRFCRKRNNSNSCILHQAHLKLKFKV